LVPTFTHLRRSKLSEWVRLNAVIFEKKLGELLGVANNVLAGLLRPPFLSQRCEVRLEAVCVQVRQKQEAGSDEASPETTDDQFHLGWTDFPIFERFLKIIQMFGQGLLILLDPGRADTCSFFVDLSLGIPKSDRGFIPSFESILLDTLAFRVRIANRPSVGLGSLAISSDSRMEWLTHFRPPFGFRYFG
jgi:hypothetical protein